MRISLIKPGFDLNYSLLRTDDSTFGGMSEVKGVYDLCRRLGHDVNMNRFFDSTDLILVFNSGFKEELKEIKESNIPKLQIVTDLNLQFTEEEIGKHVVSSQSTLDPNYFPFQMLYLKYNQYRFIPVKKYNMIYAGGTREGKRDDKYTEYLTGSHVDKIYSSSKLVFLQDKNEGKIPCNKLQDEYYETKFSIVICDDDYSKKNFLTQRYFEYMRNGMVAFVDKDYDPKGDLIPLTDWRRVKDKSDLLSKVNEMDFNMYNYVIQQQQRELLKYYYYILSHKCENDFEKILDKVVGNDRQYL